MHRADTLPSKAQIFDYWKDRFREIGIFIDWGEPSCWACRFHYGTKYDIKRSNAGWSEIYAGWDRIPLQRCHIVPRSLGGTDDVSNLFLMCRECHDLAPNTAIPDIFFNWVRSQSFYRRDSDKIHEALRAFGVGQEQQEQLVQLIETAEFKTWLNGKSGLHWPQSNYASASARLTPTTIVGLAIHYLKFESPHKAMPITIYGIKNCDTMKKARAWLDKQGVAYDFHDYKTKGIERERLERWAKKVGWETLLNRAGTTFRKLPDKGKEGVTEKKAIALMLKQPSMIKRPVLELSGGKLLVGFKPEEYEKVI